MNSILDQLWSFIDRLGVLVLTIADMIVQGKNTLAEIHYKEFGERIQWQVRRAGIIALICIGVLLAMSVAGLWCGYTGHWVISSWLLGWAIVGLGLLMLFEQAVFAALGIMVFGARFAALAGVYPAFMIGKGLLGEIGKMLKLPGKLVEWIPRLGKVIAIQLNTWGKKSPEEIRQLFELMEKPEGDQSHPDQQAWDDNWREVNGMLNEAKQKAEEVAQTIFFYTEACLGFLAFMAIFFFVVAPNSETASAALGLDSSIKGFWLDIVNSRRTLLAVTLIGLFGAFTVSRKPKLPEATQ
ncbi:MAG: hypothetical protein NTZ18_03995 [Candidatus Komeilibacteria bacterium]|nr:hypothetical protein [Candidatus Komeilibacteria bacterium]